MMKFCIDGCKLHVDEDDGVADEYYTEVPESKPYPWKVTADRPVPPLPQQSQPPISSQPTSCKIGHHYYLSR